MIFPGMVTPLLVGRPRSLAALDEAMKGERFLLVLHPDADERRRPRARGPLRDRARWSRSSSSCAWSKAPSRILVEGVCRGRRIVSTRPGSISAPTYDPAGARGSSPTRWRRMVRSVSSAVHRIRPAQQAHPRRGAALGASDRGPPIVRRLHRLAPDREDRFTSSRCSRPSTDRRRASALLGDDSGRGAGDPASGEEDRGRSAQPGAEEPERVLSQRAVEGDPQGAGPRRRGDERGRRVRERIGSAGMPASARKKSA